MLLLAGRRDKFAAAISDAAAWVLAVTLLVQIVGLLARTEAWHLSIGAAPVKWSSRLDGSARTPDA